MTPFLRPERRFAGGASGTLLLSADKAVEWPCEAYEFTSSGLELLWVSELVLPTGT